MTMDWADDVAAVVQMSYLGQETGAALAAVLFGDADVGPPDHHLPARLEDSPASGNFPGQDGTVELRRGRLRRLPPLRHVRGRPALVLRARPVVHDVRLLPLTIAAGGSDDGDDATVVRCRSTSPTPATAPAARSSRCTCAVDAPVARPDRELKAFEKVASTRARPPP